MTDELTPRKRKSRSSSPLEVPRARKRSSISPPHGDALGQAHPAPPAAVPVDAEPVRPSVNRDERVARRAYELYQARRGSNGDSLQDWLEAEQQIDAELAAESPDRR